MDESAVREALKSKLDPIPNLQVSAWFMTNPTPPTAHILSGEVEFDQAFNRGLDQLILIVQVLVGAASERGAQHKLAKFRAGSGSLSVKEKLESDRTLGGIVQNLRVTGISRDQFLTFDGKGPYLGAEWRVEVNGRG